MRYRLPHAELWLPIPEVVLENLLIRPAEPRDCGVIAVLIKELAAYEKLLHEAVATEESIKSSLFGSRPCAEALLAEAGGETLGFALFFHNYSTFLGRKGLYIEDIFVRPRFRGQGVGQKLFKKLVALAAERGCGRMEWSVLDWNEPAIRFYKALGAKPMAGWTVYRLPSDSFASLI